MGQRHQIFLIARVKGRYQCVAAFHSQWLFGRMVVNTAARLIRAFVNPINAAAIANELATLDDLDFAAIVNPRHDDQENPAILCPYLTGLFLTCSRVNMEYRRIYMMHIEKVSLRPSQLRNDDGYTFFDLTEPWKPRYCFCWPRSAPLTAFQYLSYYDDEKNRPIDIESFSILGHCGLLDVATLAAVWPRDFAEQLPHGQRPSTLPPYSPLARSAMSTIGGLRASNADIKSEQMSYALFGLLFAMYADANPEEAFGGLPGPPCACPPSPQSFSSFIGQLLSAVREQRSSSVGSTPANQYPPDRDQQELTAVLLNQYGVPLLKRYLFEEQARSVDLRSWVSSGALDASMLLQLTEALVHVEFLDLSFSSTLTAEIVEALVPRLPNLKHLVAFSCPSLGPLTTALPLTTYLASLPVHDSVDQSRFVDDLSTSRPECVRWVEESDPPAGLSVLLFCPSLSPAFREPRTTRRYGVELAHFGAEGVILGFTRFLDRLYSRDYDDSEGGCYFEMRAYFHATGLVPVPQCLPACPDPSGSASYGCMPSLIRDVSPEDGSAYPQMKSTASSGSLPIVPRHPGWVLIIDTKGTMPFHTNPPKSRDSLEAKLAMFKSVSGTVVRALHNSARAEGRPVSGLLTVDDFMRSVSPDIFAEPQPPPPLPDTVRPEYAFERWDSVPRGGGTTELQPVERVSVREWAARLPPGHGTVPEYLLAKCERTLVKLNFGLRGSSSESPATGPLIGSCSAWSASLSRNRSRASPRAKPPRPGVYLRYASMAFL